MTQKEAVSFCESEQEVPAHLIEVDSQEENQAIHCEDERREKTYRGYKQIRYWMGIKEWAGEWIRESDGKSITFFNWLRTMGNTDFACAILQRSPRGTFWKDKDCDMTRSSTYIFSALCELD